MPLRREHVELASLLEAVAAEARLQAPECAIETSVRPDGLTLSADPDRIHQVLANLTANALRHSPAGRPVRLSAASEGDDVVLTVADEGPGIPHTEAARVFERFYRADHARPHASGGAGLGLSIARWIVDLHGGDIRPQTNQPTGCAMVVRLPAEGAARP